MKLLLSFLLFATAPALALEYGDRWNYDRTTTREDGFKDYGPFDWEKIVCDEETVEGLDACLAYRDKWHTGQGWEIKDNYCQWCPLEKPDSCGRHHMSPINLERNRGLGYWGKTEENNGKPGLGTDPEAKECIDVHWMKVNRNEGTRCILEFICLYDLMSTILFAFNHSMKIVRAVSTVWLRLMPLPSNAMHCESPNPLRYWTKRQMSFALIVRKKGVCDDLATLTSPKGLANGRYIASDLCWIH